MLARKGYKMLQTEEAKQRLRQMRIRLVQSLAINALIPLVLYLLLRPLFADDATPLAIAGLVPAMRTIALWVMRRRVEWIGVYAVLGFVIAVIISALSGGNSLLLKIHEELLAGAIGLILLISAIMKKPLLQPLFQIFTRSDLDRSSNPVSYKRIAVITALIGLMLLGNAVAHVILALTLPTATFLVMSRVVTLAVLGGGVALAWWTRQRVGGFEAQDAKDN